MNFIRQILNDFIGILHVCNLRTGIKWLLYILFTLPSCINNKNLQPADKKFGEGPIKVKAKYGTINLLGGQIFSTLREIWIRNVYLKNHFVKIPEEGMVIDLGANVGGFSMLALSNSKNCKVIAVEPNSELNRLFIRQINYNNFNDRVILQRYFIGSFSQKQKEMLKNPFSSDAEYISQNKFIELNNLNKIDFLKCDIEGSEFEFIKDTSLLQITKQLAIEIHDFAGNRNEFITKLIELGFQIGPIKNDFESCILLAKRKN